MAAKGRKERQNDPCCNAIFSSNKHLISFDTLFFLQNMHLIFREMNAFYLFFWGARTKYFVFCQKFNIII
jgi:hypothetical protein